jgi:hypothetical protein
VEKIRSGESPISMIGYPKVVLHIVPLSVTNSSIKYNISSINEHLNNLESPNAPTINRYYNFDGYVTYSKLEDSLDAPSYVQLFRNGSFEAVWTYLFMRYREEKKIPSKCFEESLLNKVRFYSSFQKYYLKVEPLIFIMVSLIDVSGYIMAVDTRSFKYGEVPYGNPIDRPTLIVPESMIENSEDDVDKVMKPIFDVIWNAAGWPGSLYYGNQGKRKE